jgi:hypothetical protein
MSHDADDDSRYFPRSANNFISLQRPLANISGQKKLFVDRACGHYQHVFEQTG